MSFVSAPPRNSWRLKTTLKRRVEYRPIESDDVKYAWAAYKKGGLSHIGSVFSQEMTPVEFSKEFQSFVLANFDACWTLSSTTKSGFKPVGFVFNSWAPMSAYMVVCGIVWFPWASKRNIVESLVNFMKEAGKEYPMIGYARPSHKKLYEVCCMHGIMRRIGTSMLVFPGDSAAVFETRAVQ